MEKQDKLLALRHSCEHALTMAMLRLWPGKIKAAIGPATEDGFYFDFDSEIKISEADFAKIEKEMAKIIKENLSIIKDEMSVKEARKFFNSGTYEGNEYKHEWIAEIEKRGEGVSVYWMGKTGRDMPETFVDICAGPHLKSTGEIGVFKLLRIAGAYWHEDENNKMLTRIYGTAFETQAELDEYLLLLEEAKKRDHRKIGAEQELFFFDERVGKGLVMWLPNGTIIRNEIEKLAIEKENQAGYVRVRTPHLAKEELYLASGHLPYYKNGMYPPMVMDDGVYYLKAMNCPHHHVIYNYQPKSYRDLPVRIAEYGECYRNELSGTLAGLLRVRCMAMNDAHIYCRKDQVKAEFKNVMELTMDHFAVFGLKDYWFRLSKWSPDHLEKYINEPKNWEYTQDVIREVLAEMKVKYVEADDEAAFYGPKVDVQFKSIVGREETMSTIQLDFVAKQRFNLNYTDESGADNNEVFVIHRSPLSTHERFTAFLIEHYAGVWPVWLSPVQILFAPVAAKHQEGAKVLVKELIDNGIRVEVDDADETVGNKVRKAAGRKIPYIIIVGDKELSGEDWMIRIRGEKDQVKMSKEDFVERILGEIKNRS